jgi:hypothetical protein
MKRSRSAEASSSVNETVMPFGRLLFPGAETVCLVKRMGDPKTDNP